MRVRVGNTRISRKVLQVLAYIDLHYNNGSKLINAASQVGYHPGHLCRKFRAEVGIPYHKYIETFRIEKATTLLLESEKSIKEISYDVGFSRPELFSKAFKRINQCSPGEFRLRSLSLNGGMNGSGQLFDYRI